MMRWLIPQALRASSAHPGIEVRLSASHAPVGSPTAASTLPSASTSAPWPRGVAAHPFLPDRMGPVLAPALVERHRVRRPADLDAAGAAAHRDAPAGVGGLAAPRRRREASMRPGAALRAHLLSAGGRSQRPGRRDRLLSAGGAGCAERAAGGAVRLCGERQLLLPAAPQEGTEYREDRCLPGLDHGRGRDRVRLDRSFIHPGLMFVSRRALMPSAQPLARCGAVSCHLLQTRLSAPSMGLRSTKVKLPASFISRPALSKAAMASVRCFHHRSCG